MKITLEVLKELVAANTPVKPIIKLVWIDYGAGWQEKTLVAPETNDHMSYQMLCPRDIDKIKNGTFTIEDAQEFINKINEKEKKYEN